MATIASNSGNLPIRNELQPQTALKYAWFVWLTMLAIPFLYFLYVVWSMMSAQTSAPDRWLGDKWFITSVVYMVLVAPGSFFVRSRLFRNYWKGQPVPPRDYLKGMFTAWGALELGGILSLSGCLATGALLPNLFPALAGVVLFVALWPNGRAMISGGRGASDDPERYEEPR
jgi:hypothetical protein